MSRDGKKNNHHDGEGGGGCCGGCAGCLVLLAAGAVVFGMLLLTPYLREHNWTKEGMQDRLRCLKERIELLVDEFVRKVKDTIENPSHARENMQEFKERVKDTAEDTGTSLTGSPSSEPVPDTSSSRKNTDTEEPAVLPGAETPDLKSELIED